MRTLTPVFSFILLAATAAAPVAACPVCDSGTGQDVRAGIFDRELATNVIATLAPFAVVGGVVTLVHFGPPWRRDRRRTGDTPEGRP